jgi:hypothetical protein
MFSCGYESGIDTALELKAAESSEVRFCYCDIKIRRVRSTRPEGNARSGSYNNALREYNWVERTIMKELITSSVIISVVLIVVKKKSSSIVTVEK